MMESSAPEASTSTSPIAYVPPRPWAHSVPRKSILKRPPPPTRSFFNLTGFTRDILPGSLSKFIPSTSNSGTGSTGSPSTSAGSFKGASVGHLLPSAVPLEDSSPASTQSPLKRAHFILPHLSTVYLISSQAAPSSAELTEARREIDDKARELRDKEKEEGAGAWSLGRVEEFYRECCRLRDENVLGGVVGAFRQANLIAPRTLDLTSVRLSFDASAALADVFSLEWGLRKLILRDCDLDESSLKPLLHALLIPDSLPYLSLSSNKRLKAPAFRLLGVYMSRSGKLEFLDISQIPLDKRSIEYIVSALQPAPPSESTSHSSPVTSNAQFGESTSPSGISQPGAFAPTSPILSPSFPQFPLRSELSLKGPNALPEKVDLLSLRMDECQLRGGALEALAHAIRTSSIQHLSLRSNRIGQPGAVSLALMIKDYPDSVPAPAPTTSTLSRPSSSIPSTPTSPYFTRSPGAHLPPASRLSSLPPPGAASQAPSVTPATPSVRSQLRINPLASPTFPPRHPGGSGFTNAGSTNVSPAPQTTYTPYIPRSKRNMIPPPVSAPLTPMPVPSTPPSTYRDSRYSLPNASDVPTFTSSRTGGITTRHPVSPVITGGNSTTPVNGTSSRFRRASSDTISPGGAGTLDGHSAALLDKVRSLDTLPRLGALQTLDLRGNDLRAGVSYIAQVLKRNRTLKVLNLADNRVEVGGFVAIAEALKYNSTLETLDMSGNPCCGPSLEGVTAIRTAFTINTALKRLSLSSTGLNSDGAIALAEFLPDARRLLHLDLTHNPLDIAGVMALSVGLKVNHVMRCLDVNVPPNDSEMARLSREILRCCVRNTELVAGALPRAGTDSDASTSFANMDSEAGLPGEERGSSSLSMSEDLDLLFGSSARGGVWVLIERSELARGVKQDVERERVGQERQAMGKLGNRQKLEIWNKTPEELMKAARDLLREAHSAPADIETEPLLERGQVLVSVVIEMVQVEKDPARLEELLELNDRLTSLIKDLKTGHAPYGSERPGVHRRTSKGKEKATEKTDILLSPSFSITDSDDEDNGSAGNRGPPHVLTDEPEEDEHLTSDPSPTILSKSWVEEEGEIFRRGNVLLRPEELEEGGVDISSEELKRELLEAQLERPRPRLEGDDVRRSDDLIRQENPP